MAESDTILQLGIEAAREGNREEARNLFVRPKAAQLAPDPLQLGIGKTRVEGAVADRMDRLPVPPATALRNRVMPLDALSQRAGAEPAGWRAGVGHSMLLQSAIHYVR